MKKYGKAITILTLVISSMSSFAQSNNLSSLHNYKRPVEKKITQKNQMEIFVVESSASNRFLESNSSANYKKPTSQNNVKSEVALRPILVASGSELKGKALASRNYKHHQHFNFAKNNAPFVNPVVPNSELKKEEDKKEKEKNRTETMEK